MSTKAACLHSHRVVCLGLLLLGACTQQMPLGALTTPVMGPRGMEELSSIELSEKGFAAVVTDYQHYIGENLRAVDPEDRPTLHRGELPVANHNATDGAIEGVAITVRIDAPLVRDPEAPPGTGYHEVWVDVEFAGGRLRHAEFDLDPPSCDELQVFATVVGHVPDGRTLVSAGADCISNKRLRGSEFTLLIDPDQQDARLVWMSTRQSEESDFSDRAWVDRHTEVRVNGDELRIVQVETWERLDPNNEEPYWLTVGRVESELRRMKVFPRESESREAWPPEDMLRGGVR